MDTVSVIVASGNRLTFTNCFWESKLLSVPFNMQSPAMQMLPSGNLFGLSSDERLSFFVPEVT